MTDETPTQLTTDDYILPAYTRGALWVATDEDAQPIDGKHGMFAMPVTQQTVTLRWQAHDGPALLSLIWNNGKPRWDGSVRVGGYADALHLCAVPNTGEYVHMLYMGGQPLQYNPATLSRQHNHLQSLGRSPDFHHRMALNLAETVTTWLIPYGNPLAEQVYNAMLHNARMHLFGRLAEDNHPYADYFSMPLILEALTLFPS